MRSVHRKGKSAYKARSVRKVEILMKPVVWAEHQHTNRILNQPSDQPKPLQQPYKTTTT